MANFLTSYQKTDKFEGGYSNRRTDRGGETYRGISRNNWPNWPGWIFIDNLKKESGWPDIIESPKYKQGLDSYVVDFYRKNFWDALRLDEINSQEVADEMYDTAVNMGCGIAARFLQRSLNVMNRGGSAWPDVAVDGLIGSKTVHAANLAPAQSLVKILNALQCVRYVELCEADRSQEDNLNGWINNRI